MPAVLVYTRQLLLAVSSVGNRSSTEESEPALRTVYTCVCQLLATQLSCIFEAHHQLHALCRGKAHVLYSRWSAPVSALMHVDNTTQQAAGFEPACRCVWLLFGGCNCMKVNILLLFLLQLGLDFATR